MARSAAVKHDLGYLSALPLGSIIAWHRDFSEDYVPLLPPGWVECDGQTLDDPESPYHDHLIPDLNGDAGTGQGGLFLRGHVRSGDRQGDQLQSHKHLDEGHRHDDWRPSGRGGGLTDVDDDYRKEVVPTELGHANLGEPVALDGSLLGERVGTETRPANMSVIWIIKIKHTTAARAVPAVQADANAPIGAVCVDRAGNVGIGTSTPKAPLEVSGDIQAANVLSAETFTALLTNGAELEASTADVAPVMYRQVEQNTAPDVFEMQEDGVLVIRRAGIVSLSACMTIGMHDGKNGDFLVDMSAGFGVRALCPIAAVPSHSRCTARCQLYQQVNIDEAISFRTTAAWIAYVGSGLGWSGPSGESYLTVLWLGVR